MTAAFAGEWQAGSCLSQVYPARSPPCMVAGPCTLQEPLPRVREGQADRETEAVVGMP